MLQDLSICRGFSLFRGRSGDLTKSHHHPQELARWVRSLRTKAGRYYVAQLRSLACQPPAPVVGQAASWYNLKNAILESCLPVQQSSTSCYGQLTGFTCMAGGWRMVHDQSRLTHLHLDFG